VIKSSYDVDLSHGVDENNCEDGDGQPQQEGPAQVPDDASQSEKEMKNIEMKNGYIDQLGNGHFCTLVCHKEVSGVPPNLELLPFN
jgi:hypothetical protein